MKRLWHGLLAAGLLVGLVSAIHAASPLDRSALGRTDKLRILVDKVLMADNNWVMTEEHVKEIAGAGFNVVSPREGNEDLAEVRKIAGLAEQYGMFHLPWMRGDMIARGPVKMVWASGVEQELASPNSDELWTWMTDQIIGYAQLSLQYPALMGVFLDYENYSPNSGGNLYELSYDNKIMGEFAAAKGVELPELPFDQRYDWLVNNKLHDQFAAFQINQWQERCRRLRQAVDAINPQFQFCVYPVPASLFLTEAAWPGWATQAAPLIVADPSIYGRPAGLMPHRQALAANSQILLKDLAFAKGKHFPMMFAGGLDPAVRGADPEFSGRNAAMSACQTDGYWVFYEGPAYHTTHQDYFRWFTRANQAITGGEARAFWQAPRQTPDTGDAASFAKQTNKPQLGVFDSRDLLLRMLQQEGTFEVHDLIGLALDYLKHFDVVLLQNYNVAQMRDEPSSLALRAYVEEGGGLLLAHDTAWFMDSPFPEIAIRGYPQYHVEAERHVVGSELKVVKEHPALDGLPVDAQFKPEFIDHMIFKPGPGGITVIENTFGDPVYVLGEVGKGRVAFVGQYHCYENMLEGPEKQAFLGVLKWLS
ncbi:MAG: hypothetical protein IT369_21965, partial [Candidatus Latescibacteria bacterium]|nr:hypothetical protein [Candidatus Latescibacterota bacterium]